MSQHYSMPESERSKWTLPDIEVFYMSAEEFLTAGKETWMFEQLHGLLSDCEPSPSLSASICAKELAGYYWWTCLPGCLPDSDPYGPFDTEQDAIDNATENY